MMDRDGGNYATIRGAWETLEAMAVDPACGPGGRKSARWAFYAGAAAMYNLVVATGDGSLTEREGLEAMRRLGAEIRGFVGEVHVESLIGDLEIGSG